MCTRVPFSVLVYIPVWLVATDQIPSQAISLQPRWDGALWVFLDLCKVTSPVIHGRLVSQFICVEHEVAGLSSTSCLPDVFVQILHVFKCQPCHLIEAEKTDRLQRRVSQRNAAFIKKRLHVRVQIPLIDETEFRLCLMYCMGEMELLFLYTKWPGSSLVRVSSLRRFWKKRNT